MNSSSVPTFWELQFDNMHAQAADVTNVHAGSLQGFYACSLGFHFSPRCGLLVASMMRFPRSSCCLIFFPPLSQTWSPSCSQMLRPSCFQGFFIGYLPVFFHLSSRCGLKIHVQLPSRPSTIRICLLELVFQVSPSVFHVSLRCFPLSFRCCFPLASPSCLVFAQLAST